MQTYNRTGSLQPYDKTVYDLLPDDGTLTQAMRYPAPLSSQVETARIRREQHARDTRAAILWLITYGALCAGLGYLASLL